MELRTSPLGEIYCGVNLLEATQESSIASKKASSKVIFRSRVLVVTDNSEFATRKFSLSKPNPMPMSRLVQG